MQKMACNIRTNHRERPQRREQDDLHPNTCTTAALHLSCCACVHASFPHLIYQIKVVQYALVGAISVVYSHVLEYKYEYSLFVFIQHLDECMSVSQTL